MQNVYLKKLYFEKDLQKRAIVNSGFTTLKFIEFSSFSYGLNIPGLVVSRENAARYLMDQVIQEKQ